jgi:hypothetical protein
MQARPADHRNYQVAWLEAAHGSSGFYYLSQRLVSQHKKVEAFRWRAVMEARNLAVCSTHANFQHPKLDIGGRRDSRLVEGHHLNLVL